MSEPTAAPATATGTGTDTTYGARLHARAQAGAVVEHMPTLPATAYADAPPGVDPSALVWAERVAGGGYTHRVVRRGTTVRLTDVDGDACAHLLVYRAGAPWERLNVADTVKVQWNAYLGVGQLLLSDQGRVLASILTDTSGHHDTLCGTSSRMRNEHRYGSGQAQGPSPAGRELFVLAAAKHGLGPVDIPPAISFFKGVRVEPETGDLTWVGAAPDPSHVELRAELDLLVLIANTAHPVDPRPEWSCSTLEVLAWPGDPTPPDRWPATASPEASRAFANNEEDLAAREPGARGEAS
ncbi:MAG: urea amidolyase associated protein UAAP1 [Acidimicrobiales bacterium]|jgi:urea carboxylase-associated protein 2